MIDTETISSRNSSPPPAAPLAEDGHNELSLHQPNSPAFSTTSTADDQGSSPILPPLPAPSFRGRTFEHQRSRTPSESRTESSFYYTASWGSPYQQPPAGRARSHAHTNTLSSLDSEPDSPIHHIEFHTPFLRPAPTFGGALQQTNPDFVSSDGLVSAAVLANRARRPTNLLTEDWIRQHTGGESAERNNWLSDPGDSENSSLSGSVSGDNRENIAQDLDPQTPTIKTYKEAARQRLRPKHRRVHTTETLKQEDFLDRIPAMSLTDANNLADMEMYDRPPTPPPKDSRDVPLNTVASISSSVDSRATVAEKDTAVAPLLKKKVLWKGKNIIVSLPMDDERGQKGKAPTPMTERDVNAMIKEWEQLGYDTTGFNLGPEFSDSQEGSQGQSRSPWPLAQDMHVERQKQTYNVNIPNRKEWDDYVRELSEAKLRALGVSFGDDPSLPLVSPAVSNISNMHNRRTSMAYPALPFSPPIPTSSANSSHLNHQLNPFSPVLMPGTNGLSTGQSTRPGSIASPASMHAHLQAKYNPRQSVSFSGAEHPFGSPFQYPQQNSPTVWSPQQMLYQQGHLGQSRGESPSVSIQNLGAMVSPALPLTPDGYFPPNGDMLAQMQQRQQILQNQISQNQLSHQQQLQLQGGARASPRLQEVREEDETISKSPSKTLEARQTMHNASSALQQEIDDAEYHLEEQMQRELEHEDYSPHSDKENNQYVVKQASSHVQARSGMSSSRYANDGENGPVLHHPQPHSRGHSLSQRPFQGSEDSGERKLDMRRIVEKAKSDLSDIETNPSNQGTPTPDGEVYANGQSRPLSVTSNPWVGPDAGRIAHITAPKRGHKSTMSTLNVGAKEFKFNPSSSFGKPSALSFNGNNFQSPMPFGAFAPPVPGTASHFSQDLGAGSRGQIDVAAPAFTPSHSNFSFSPTGPSFKPDAVAFTPPKATFSDSVGSNGQSSIFGSIDLSTINNSRSSKKSKAVPIVRPDSSHSKKDSDEFVEGKDGRITQGEGRFKRVRGAKEDVDSIPLFSEPSMPLGETTRGQSPPKENSTVVTSQADKENSAPLEIAEQMTSQIQRSLEDDKDFVPYEFNQQKQAEDFNAARPFASQKHGSNVSTYDTVPAAPDDDIRGTIAEPQKLKGHRKSGSSLSAKAKPFEFKPGAFGFSVGESSDATPVLASPLPALPSAGLSASKYARSPSPDITAASPDLEMRPDEIARFQASLPGPESPPTHAADETAEDREPTFEEIDAIMTQLNENELGSANKWAQSSPTRQFQMPDLDNSSPIRLQPRENMRSDAPSPSPGRFEALPGHSNVFGRVHEGDRDQQGYESPILHLHNMDSMPPSEWDDVLSETEEAKLQPRAQFFDNHVNELVGGLLAERLDPMERVLETIQMSLDMMAARAPSSRRDRRSNSGARSDADDEEDDDNDVPRRSHSPKKDKKLEKIRSIVMEALATHQVSRPTTAVATTEQPVIADSSDVLAALEEMKDAMRLDLRGEDIRKIVEESVESRLPTASNKAIVMKLREASASREADFKAKIADLEERLVLANGDNTERTADLEERLLRADIATEQEIKTRRAAEDRLAEVQRLLRISSEEETRLRETLDEKDIKLREIATDIEKRARAVEEHRSKTIGKIASLEAALGINERTQTEQQHRMSRTENDLHQARQDTQRWQMEAERAMEAARRHNEDAEQANETNKNLRHTIESLRTQMEESVRVREGFRGKLTNLQEVMASAAREITQENALRAKKEQELIARQEVLDAKLQAEARTRERLETEIERLEAGEREGMRAVSESKKMEIIIAELRMESHNSQKDAMRYQREFEEARESGLSEVQRTRHYMQAEIESANNQVNVVREDLEHQILRLRAEMDSVRLEADTARAKSEMLIEEADNSKASVIADFKLRHDDELEDIQTRHERQLNNTIEDAQRAEQHLLERLSLSSAKTEHLQDRVSHLEEKLEIANQAASAAIVAAKTARSASIPNAPNFSKPIGSPSLLPEKISPQALRESIMVLQEQLQQREHTIESLEATLATVDPESASKISKRDDEIMWLRELLAVRKSDLQDIVTALLGSEYDPERVRDAAIRLRANLQMEEQERERALNGGSALNLNAGVESVKERLRDVASSPRVASAVGPLAAAWGNWRKGKTDSVASGSQSLYPRSRESTPSRAAGSTGNANANGTFLSGLLTPPASNSNLRGHPHMSSGSGALLPSNPNLARSNEVQPTAFGSTGKRLTREGSRQSMRSGGRPGSKLSMAGSENRSEMGREQQPSTPTMVKRMSSFDSDARVEEYSDAGFYDDDESTVDDASGYAAERARAGEA